MSESVYWDRLFRPRRVAILGISSRSGTFQIGAGALLEHLVKHGFAGEILPISRSQPEICGYKTYPNLAALPSVPDCLVVAVPAPAVVDSVREALTLGIRSFVVISSGFAETGPAGAALQAELVAVVREGGGLLLGPNTTGYVNLHDQLAMSSTSRLRGGLPPSGGVGLIVQSGALGSALLDLATDRKIGLSHLISSGNEGSHGLAEFIDFLVEDENTRVIALYVEGFKHPSRFVTAVRTATARGKPIVILKMGETETGKKAAAGHTGALAGSRRVQNALFRQLGLISVGTLEALLETAAMLTEWPGTIGRRLGILTISGGLGGLLADALIAGGIELPDLKSTTKTQLRAYLPGFLSFGNPLDNGGIPFREPGQFQRNLRDFATDPGFDGVVVALTPIVPSWAQELVPAVQAVRAELGKLVAVYVAAGSFCAQLVERLREARVPTFTSLTDCAAVLSALAAPQKARNAAAARPQQLTEVLSSTRLLDEAATKALLRRHGMPTPREIFVADGKTEALCAAAREIGYPVTLKAVVDGVAHKSELGFVRVGLSDEAALLAAVDDQRATLGAFRGFLLAETVAPAAELLVGVTVDPQFGPVLTFGAGGIFTEILDDVSLRVLPTTESELRAMVEECRVARVLHGARGRPPLDETAVIQFMGNLAGLALDLGDRLAGIEINPLAVFPAGQGVAALDAKMFLRTPA